MPRDVTTLPGYLFFFLALIFSLKDGLKPGTCLIPEAMTTMAGKPGDSCLPAVKLTYLHSGSIFQPAMLVYQNVNTARCFLDSI